ncbi:MAG TPA: YraN family protein [Burkholderiaceae bacterium]|nr:YraN family protein [Burkholderiaceae bacterium]
MQNGEALASHLAHLAQQKAVRARKRRLARAAPAPRIRTGVSPKQAQGGQAEERARHHLLDAGATVLARNLRCKGGEIDLVALDHGVLVFVEVRYRGSERFGGAAASVNRRKRQRLVLAARYFLPTLVRRYFSGHPPPCRFDVIAQTPLATTWLKHAFAEDLE